MRTHPRNRTPRVEPLESLTLLSGLPTPAAAHPLPAQAAEVQATAAPTVALDATARGDYTTSRGVADAGLTYNVFAVGRANGLGAVAVTGKLVTVGFIREGHATGTHTVRTARGNLTVDVTGPTQQGFSDLPTQFTFTVKGGTGRFRNATGTGTLNVTARPDPLNANAPNVHAHGLLTLTFRPGPVVPV